MSRICKYQIPDFLSSTLTQAQFDKWLVGLYNNAESKTRSAITKRSGRFSRALIMWATG
jgi:hypothetical protein